MNRFYRDKQLCVIGEGFLCGRVLALLSESGYERVCAVNPHDYDLAQATEVERMYSRLRPDVVIHLDALTDNNGAERDNPARIFYETLMIGAQLLEGARLHAIEKFVIVGTARSYFHDTPAPFQEKDLWNGYPEGEDAAYAVAKKLLLVQAQAYRDQYNLNAVYLLPANLYGPGENSDARSSRFIRALIQKFLDAAENNKKCVEVQVAEQATRDYLFVDDAAEGIVLATERYNDREPVNLGSGVETDMRDLAQSVAVETEFQGEIVIHKTQREREARRILNTSRASESFGFRARTSLIDGLRLTIEWQRARRAKEACEREELALDEANS